MNRKQKQKEEKHPPNKRGDFGSTIASSNPKVFFSEIEITCEPVKTDWTKQIPKEVDKQLQELYGLVKTKPKEAIDRLVVLKDKYPTVPILYNYLSIAYSSSNQHKKAQEITQENYKNNPRYLFAKINYAEICLHNGMVDLIPDIFENKFDLKMLYPHRNTFHISEAAGFFGVLGMYWHKKGMSDLANLAYDVLQKIVPNHEFTKRLGRALMMSSVKKFIGW